MSSARVQLAVRTAERFLQRRGLRRLPVDPFAIAASLDIVVQPKPETVDGVSGMLLWRGTSFGILYATHIDNAGFQRFSVSHELGHYLVPGHLDHLARTGAGWHQSRAGSFSTDPYEREADAFAAALLMPEPWFSRACQDTAPGLTAVKYLAGLCGTSLTATAKRYIDTTTQPTALILSTGRTIDACFFSPVLQQWPGLRRLLRGRQLPPSLTNYFHTEPQQIAQAREGAMVTDFQPWFLTRRPLPGVEEVIGLGRYGKTLTLLSFRDGAPDWTESRPQLGAVAHAPALPTSLARAEAPEEELSFSALWRAFFLDLPDSLFSGDC